MTVTFTSRWLSMRFHIETLLQVYTHVKDLLSVCKTLGNWCFSSSRISVSKHFVIYICYDNWTVQCNLDQGPKTTSVSPENMQRCHQVWRQYVCRGGDRLFGKNGDWKQGYEGGFASFLILLKKVLDPRH